MSEHYPSIAQCAVAAAALKVLLWPAYHSTDFEVHRNWLAITHSLPLKEWYYEKTSQWTLDYPPFFAYFELLLSQAAAFVDAGMLRVENLEYDSFQTIYFQRASVLVSELVLVYSLMHYVKHTANSGKFKAHVISLSILLSPGFFIIDHIHFQYNGMMYGILILSISFARQKSGLLWSGLLFATLLCFKHIYLYLAPAYFILLLRAYCLSPRSIFIPNFANCLKLGGGIVAVVAAAFGPFVFYGQIPQVLGRLFPFSRGLCHAYWAPNFWALYSFADRLLIHAAPYLKLAINEAAKDSVTRGLVGDTAFAVLPEITPKMTFLITLAAQAPALAKLAYSPTGKAFIGALTLCGYASFMFGWHVHEKAILLVIIPFSLLSLEDKRYLIAFQPLAIAGHISLLPLLFTKQEYPIKTAYTTLWLIVFLTAFNSCVTSPKQSRWLTLGRLSTLYSVLAIPVFVYASIVHELLFGLQYEFLPLMLISVYCAVAILGSWLGFMYVFLIS